MKGRINYFHGTFLASGGERRLKKTKTLSLRHFLAVGGLATAGGWLTLSDQFSARFARAVITETGRGTVPSRLRPAPATWNADRITATWIGHATVLLNFYGTTILTDPVFSNRVGANLGFGTLGRKRQIAPALTFDDLPPIDLVLLSHAHMDHFDLPTLRRFPSDTPVITAHRTQDLLAGMMVAPTELAWGDEKQLSSPAGDLRIEAFQVNHWGARWRSDTFRGYNGYIIEKAGKKIIFGGDTALCDHFRAISRQGPFELALMPIGSYRPGRSSHCTPEESAQMFRDSGARYILPIHHKTFALGPEPANEPIARLGKVVPNEQIALREVGETFSLA